MAEIVWQGIVLESLRIYYGELGFPPDETLSNYTSRDPAAMSRWYLRLVKALNHHVHTYFWHLRWGKDIHDGVYFASLYHQRRKAADWMLWDYGYFLEVRFHPSTENNAEELVENLFKPLQRRLVEGGFSSLEGLPIEISYTLGDTGLRSQPLSEFFNDVGIHLYHSLELPPD